MRKGSPPGKLQRPPGENGQVLAENRRLLFRRNHHQSRGGIFVVHQVDEKRKEPRLSPLHPGWELPLAKKGPQALVGRMALQGLANTFLE